VEHDVRTREKHLGESKELKVKIKKCSVEGKGMRSVEDIDFCCGVLSAHSHRLYRVTQRRQEERWSEMSFGC
jgi:hypothetical protein